MPRARGARALCRPSAASLEKESATPLARPLRPARAKRLRLAGRSAPPAYIGGPLPPSLHAHPFPAVSSSFPPLASPLPSPRAGGGRSERASERAGAGLLLGAWLGSVQARRSCREPPALGGVRSGSHERRGGGLLGLAPKVAAREEVETLRKCSSPRLAAGGCSGAAATALLPALAWRGARLPSLACLPSAPAAPFPRALHLSPPFRRPARSPTTWRPLGRKLAVGCPLPPQPARPPPNFSARVPKAHFGLESVLQSSLSGAALNF